MSTYRDLLGQVKRDIREENVRNIEARRSSKENFVILDVREKHEWDEGHLPDAVHIERGFLEQKIEGAVRDKNTPIVVYCQGGSRSAFAAKTLQELGYKNVISMAGGYGDWKNNGLPFVVPEKLSKNRLARYSRHLK